MNRLRRNKRALTVSALVLMIAMVMTLPVSPVVAYAEEEPSFLGLTGGPGDDSPEDGEGGGPTVGTSELHIVLASTEDMDAVLTPTENGNYDTDDSSDAYLPGRDAAEKNAVSRWKKAVYPISISLSSGTWGDVAVEKVEIFSVDEDGNSLGNTIPVYRINDSADPNDTEDGAHPLEARMSARMLTIDKPLFDESASTAKTEAVIELQSDTYWKSMIAPRLMARVTTEDGAVAESDVLELPAVRFTSAGSLSGQIGAHSEKPAKDTPWQRLADGREGFLFHFRINANYSYNTPSDCNRLGDLPDYETMTYVMEIDPPTVNGKTVTLGESSFTFSPDNSRVAVESVQYIQPDSLGGKGELRVTLKRTGGVGGFTTWGTFFLPCEKPVSSMFLPVSFGIRFKGEDVDDNMVFEGFENRLLYTLSSYGGFGYKGDLLAGEGAGGGLWLQEDVDAKDAGKGEAVKHIYRAGGETGFIDYSGAIFAELLSSGALGFAEGGSLTAGGAPVEAEVLYGYAADLKSNNVNLVAARIRSGELALTSDYASLPEVPNIKAFRVTGELGAGTDGTEVEVQDSYLVRRPDERIGPDANFYGNNLYVFTSLKTKIGAEQIETYKGALGPVDSFVQQDGAVYLNLGATAANEGRVTRFGMPSCTYSPVSLKSLFDTFVVGISTTRARPCRQ